MARHSIEIPFKKSKDSFFDDDSSLHFVSFVGGY